ncbi:MAG: HDIG domain-containing protein [Bacteroidales bacterium]|nr:HDIG domain-containing protein [Bacteroidales bacterium]
MRSIKDKIDGVTRNQRFVVAGLFLIVGVIIISIFPTAAKFEYKFEKDGIWQKDALTAPFPFTVYKLDSEIKEESDSLVKRQFQPYFTISDTEREKAISKLNQKTRSEDVADSYTKYIKSQFFNIYQKGIMDADDFDRFKDSFKTIRIKGDDANAFVEMPLNSVYTPKTAYEHILNKAPATLDKEILSRYDIDRMLFVNLIYDEKISELARQDIIKSIITTIGTVKEGEKIVDKGDKITDKVFCKLTSLERAIENGEGDSSNRYLVKIGQVIIVSICLLTFYFYLTLFRTRFIQERRNVVFMLLMILSLCGLTSFVVRYSPDWVHAIPYTILPIVIATFFDTRTALFMHNTTVLICSFIVHEGVEFLLMQVVIGMLTICILKDMYERSQLVKTVIIIFAAYIFLYFGSTLIYTSKWVRIDAVEFINELGPFVMNASLLLFAYPLIYIIEKTFNYVSDVTLVELANTNNPLLLQFSEVAPGSFQHSMQVANLADAAAREIGAKPMLVRTGALYHDIGKMENPVFFTENQSGVNPHDALNDEESSARIIIDHVANGLRIAKANGLPEKIQDFIRTHHGTSQAKYFYIKACNKHPDTPVDISKFTYPGPRPFSREMAILMMCDAVEAASRSMKEYTDESITNLVSKIIDSQIAEGAFKDAPLTFKNIEQIKAKLIEKLKTIYHTRVSYPELKK